MKFPLILIASLIVLFAAAPVFAQSNQSDPPPTVIERPDLKTFFDRENVSGTFVLLDLQSNQLTVYDRARAEHRYRPASTFKIVNSLIALETGAVKDENQIVPYGGKPQPVKAWEHDMSMRDAIRISNVAIYQEIARRIGLDRMKANIDHLNFGNRQIGTVVDEFWLQGPLEVSAVEEAQFVAKLARQALPLSKRSQLIVRDILRVEEKNGATIYAKTGWAKQTTPPIGWWTGWVERDGKITAFSLNIDMASDADAPKRMSIVHAILSELGVL